MATIKVDKFGGIQPRLNPALLGDSMAQMAHNCTLKKGKLIPLREPSSVEGALVRYENGLLDIANTNSIHAWKRTASLRFLASCGSRRRTSRTTSMTAFSLAVRPASSLLKRRQVRA